tara:strand:+ start:502 stop:1239 length:738 start_codon:yes stop_codon:yes gene_type:complete
MTPEEIFSLLDQRREKLGMTKAELGSAAFGNPKDTSLQNIRRGSVPSYLRVARLAEVLGLDCYLGLPRNEDPSTDPIVREQQRSSLDDFELVQRFDVKLSAGPGSDGDNAQQLAPVAFRKAWLDGQNLRADRCVVTGVSGNSMEPMLFEGDLVLLNRQHSELTSGQVYGIVDIEGDIRVKRIELVDQGIILRSENPDCPSELRIGEDANRVRIIGRLAWSSHSHRPPRQRQTPRRKPKKPYEQWL